MSEQPRHLYEFGPFRLDTAAGRLLREGQLVQLQPKAFEMLVALVERGGRLVPKDELMHALWPDSYVEEGNLNHHLWTLRRALGENREHPEYIETVPRRGYRFVAEVHALADEGAAELRAEKHTFTRIVTEEEFAEVETEGRREASLPGRFADRRSGRNLKTGIAAMLAVVVVVAGGLFGIRQFFKPRPPFQSVRVSRFTASGKVLTAAISPDGKYGATVVDEGGLQSLWVRQVAANTSSVRLLEPAMVEYWGLTFSNDSNFIYYVSWVRNESDAKLYQLPVLGGTPRRLPTMPIDTPVSFSPAGDRFAYVASTTSQGASYLQVANVEGDGIQTLIKRPQPGFFTAYPGGPAWSPDGRLIACAAGSSVEAEPQRVHVFVTNVEEKAERQLTEQGWYNIGRLGWLSDGSGLVISARERMDGPRQLWFISYPAGGARRITNDLHDYNSPSLTADGKILAAIQTQEAVSISITPAGSTNQGNVDVSSMGEIFSEIGSGREGIVWTPDNRLVYCSRAGDNWDIWSMNKDGSDQRQLTVDPHNDLFPTVSRDGCYIFFASDRAGAFNIWRMERDGNNPTQLTRGVKDIFPDVTPDGQWVVYQQGPGFGLDNTSIWRVPAAGGESERVADSLTQRPAISPDGRLLAYVAMDEKGWGLVVRAVEGGGASRKFHFPSTVASRVFRWTPDGQALAYLANEKGASNIWLQPLSGEPPRPLTSFKTGQLQSFAWSPDGRWLACLHSTTTSDMVLLSDRK